MLLGIDFSHDNTVIPTGGILSAPVKNTRIIFNETLGASLVEARVCRDYIIMHNK